MVKNKQINLISEERRTFDLQAVSKMLRPLAKNLLGRYGFTEVDLLENWNDIAGDMADYTLPKQINFKKGTRTNGELSIEVPSGAFAVELQHREKFMLAKINAYFGYDAVSRLKIIQNAEIPIQDIDNVGKSQKILVTADEENYIQSLSEGVEDSALQNRLVSLGRCVFSYNKDKK